MDPQVLTRITKGDANHWYLTSASSARRDIEDIPGLDEDDKNAMQADRELNFLPIDLKKTWREGESKSDSSPPGLYRYLPQVT